MSVMIMMAGKEKGWLIWKYQKTAESVYVIYFVANHKGKHQAMLCEI
jgi:hypothetical protein